MEMPMEFEWRETFLLSLCESSNIFHQLCVHTVSVCDPSSMLHNAEVQFFVMPSYNINVKSFPFEVWL